MTTLGPRAMDASSFSVIKGSLIPETYDLFVGWDFAVTPAENMRLAREEGALSHGTINWARDISKAIRRRFTPDGRDRPFVEWTQLRPPHRIWRPLLLWHMTRDEFLVRDFLSNWLYSEHERGAFRLDPTAAEAYVSSVRSMPSVRVASTWTIPTQKRVASGLLRIAADFGLLEGGGHREFTSFHLPDESLLYLVGTMLSLEMPAEAIIQAPDWRLFLMSPSDVERELLRLHQLHQVRFEMAGSLMQLELRDFSPTQLVEWRTT